ncbi:MAG: hypothetical protein PVJ39_07825 [Gammaproteobacteria bacterium]
MQRRWLVRWVTLVLVLAVAGTASAIDRRQYQHGISLVKRPGDGYWLFWSSAPGKPPAGSRKVIVNDGGKCEYFTHDIYYASIDPEAPVISGHPLIVQPEAQEPVSAAVSATGDMLITYEDGSENDITEHCDANIQQRYQLYNDALQPQTPVETVTVSGGHSGHVAAAGGRFIIVYSEGWLDDGGVDGAGTGNDIYVDVISERGESVQHRAIAVDKGDPRDWWPLVAASSRYAVLVWQRYVPRSKHADLMYGIYDTQAGKLVRQISLLKSHVVYYHYDVQYLESINRFLVTGAYLGNMLIQKGIRHVTLRTVKGFAYLLDVAGNVIDRWDADTHCNNCGSYMTYVPVREAQPAVYDEAESIKVLYPVKAGGLLLFRINRDRIGRPEYISGNNNWFPLGTDGVFFDTSTAFFANLTPTGVKSIIVNLY